MEEATNQVSPAKEAEDTMLMFLEAPADLLNTNKQQEEEVDPNDHSDDNPS